MRIIIILVILVTYNDFFQIIAFCQNEEHRIHAAIPAALDAQNIRLIIGYGYVCLQVFKHEKRMIRSNGMYQIDVHGSQSTTGLNKLAGTSELDLLVLLLLSTGHMRQPLPTHRPLSLIEVRTPLSKTM